MKLKNYKIFLKKVLTIQKKSCRIVFVSYDVNRGVAQMGARVLWEHEVAGSIPVTPTILSKILNEIQFQEF